LQVIYFIFCQEYKLDLYAINSKSPTFMKKNLKAAIIQMQLPESTLIGEEQVDRLVKEAASQEVDIVGLPEDCLAKLDDIKNGYDAMSYLSSIAKRYGVYLFGATIVKTDDGLRNRGFLFNRSGELVHAHEKVVLTPPEVDAGLIAGKTIEVFDTEFGKMSILVCKDSFHRYAAWFFEKLYKAGVEIVLVPSYSISVSERSIELWTNSLKALAKWFSVYVLAPGTIGKNTTDWPSFGHALIICPKRVILGEGSFDKKEILRATLDVESFEYIRSSDLKWQPNEVPEVEVIAE
jgi:predicted amidohydrolase